MPVRLTAMMRSQVSGSRSKKLSRWLIPADSSTISSRPNSRTTAATALSTAPRSHTSRAEAAARPPAIRIRAAVSSAAEPSRSVQNTAAPSRAKASAPAPPMPPPAPATNATLPATRATPPSRYAVEFSRQRPRVSIGPPNSRHQNCTRGRCCHRRSWPVPPPAPRPGSPTGSSAIAERSTRCADSPSPTSCCRRR